MVSTPAKWMHISRPNVTPEVMRCIIAGTMKTAEWSQLQQLTTRNNDGGYPICVCWTAVSNFDEHTFDEPTLKAKLDLKCVKHWHNLELLSLSLEQIRVNKNNAFLQMHLAGSSELLPFCSTRGFRPRRGRKVRKYQTILYFIIHHHHHYHPSSSS